MSHFRSLSGHFMSFLTSSIQVHAHIALCLHSHSHFELAMDAGVVRQLDIRTLILSLFVIISEILRRFRIPVQIDFAVNPVDVEWQPPPQPAHQRPRPAPVIHGYGCDQFCRFCDLPCHRHKAGHSHHACYQHRHWRD